MQIVMGSPLIRLARCFLPIGRREQRSNSVNPVPDFRSVRLPAAVVSLLPSAIPLNVRAVRQSCIVKASTLFPIVQRQFLPANRILFNKRSGLFPSSGPVKRVSRDRGRNIAGFVGNRAVTQIMRIVFHRVLQASRLLSRLFFDFRGRVFHSFPPLLDSLFLRWLLASIIVARRYKAPWKIGV